MCQHNVPSCYDGSTSACQDNSKLCRHITPLCRQNEAYALTVLNREIPVFEIQHHNVEMCHHETQLCRPNAAMCITVLHRGHFNADL